MKQLQTLAKEYQTFYEVSPYYVLVEEFRRDIPMPTHKVQAGFDVDVFAVNRENQFVPPGPDPDYALAYVELQRLAAKVSPLAGNCSVEVIPFASTAIIDSRDHSKVDVLIRVRIAHSGSDQTAGQAEQQALEGIERELKTLGIARR